MAVPDKMRMLAKGQCMNLKTMPVKGISNKKYWTLLVRDRSWSEPSSWSSTSFIVRVGSWVQVIHPTGGVKECCRLEIQMQPIRDFRRLFSAVYGQFLSTVVPLKLR